MKSRIKVGTVQVNNSIANQSYFPYSVGILQAFAKKYLKNYDRFEFMPAIFSRLPVAEALSRLAGVNIACFSVYVWNMKISQKIAQELKGIDPEVLIVFGGPQAPELEAEKFLRDNPFVDIICHDEGEKTFLNVLEEYDRRRWDLVPGVSFVDKSNNFVNTPAVVRITDLDSIPSPYLEGVFDPLIRLNPKINWAALWETNRGCPFGCTYCDWGGDTKNKIFAFELTRLFREIDWFSRNKVEFVFCCDANFGILERDIEIVKYFAQNKHKYGYPQILSVQSTKSFTDSTYSIYKIMSDARINKGISLSLQSLNPDTLANIRRQNIPMKQFNAIQQKLSSYDIETFTDLILGLPSETYESFVKGVITVIENGQHNRVQFNNLSILPNAQMDNPDYQKLFGFEIIETKIVNVHGSRTSSENEVFEAQQLVVGTNTMPKPDWVKTRVFSWIVSLLHFDKLLQVPFVVLHEYYSVGYREMFDIFMRADKDFPVFCEIYSFFTDKAAATQRGEEEFCQSGQWLDMWWPADEMMMIKLCTEGKLDDFYQEAEKALSVYLAALGDENVFTVFKDAIRLNKNLIKLPFIKEDLKIEFSCNIWDLYRGAVKGVKVPLENTPCVYKIDRTSDRWQSWEEWCRKVVWYGNKRGAYIYKCEPFLENKTNASK